MDHYIRRGGRTIKVTFGCGHPDIENNTCPLRTGECSSCKWCEAIMKGSDALFLINGEEGENE